jgi:solute carrier family 25 phosphate transporter 23/24/25/41
MVSDDGSLTVWQRLACGGLAGATATTFTHPLDVIRIRLAVNSDLPGIRGAVKDIVMENGIRSLFKGYVPTLLSLSPFIAINFAAFDTLKTYFLPKGVDKKHMGNHTLSVLGCGAGAGLFAQSICFPLDTIRRRMQMKGTNYTSVLNAVSTIATTEGVRGFYRGVVPNAVKIVPNNGIRFLVYEMLKNLMGMEPSK